MNLNLILDNFHWFFFALVVYTFAWKVWNKGSIRGALLGYKVERVIGEVLGEKSAMQGVTVRVNKLEGNSDQGNVGIELVAKSFASYQMTPVTLNREAALKLAELLRTAAG